MVGYYEDENLCSRLISDIAFSVGKERDKLLRELCKFKTEAADGFWREKIRNESYLPYIMMCRSNEFSDYLADRLSDYIDRLLEGMDHTDAVNEAYFLLHICLFKESDKLFSVYEKLAKNSKRITSLAIRWNSDDIISEKSQPDFLYGRYLLEREHGCENSFFSFLTDSLILTMCNAVILDGTNETVTGKVKELYEKYPDVYGSAGFFAYFIRDNSAAYDKFADHTADPVNYPDLMWVLDGLCFENGAYTQGSPTAFTGKDNETLHFSMVLDSLDFRWYEFFTKKILADTESFTVKDPYVIPQFCRKFSIQLLNMMDKDNERAMELYREYFSKTAVIAANKADFIGLRECGLIVSDDDFRKLCSDIAERICSGQQRYCFFVLFQCFSDLSLSLRQDTLREISEYLFQNEHSEALANQRKAFLTEAERFLNGDRSAFDEVS